MRSQRSKWGRRGVALAAATASSLALSAPAAASGTDWLALRTLNIAHQGGENEAPSNTMYALERSLRLGTDMLELDIHTSSDGKLIVIHDGTVDRTTNGSGSVYDMTAAEIQALDAGHNLVPGEGTVDGGPAGDYPFRGVRLGEKRPPRGFRAIDFRIPTLPEVMRAYPRVPVNIEIKGASDEDAASFFRNAEALAAFLNELGRTRGIVVASFNDAAIARFAALAPDIDLAPSTGAVAAYKAAGVPPPAGTKVFQVPVEFGGVTVTDEAFVDQVHADGYAIHNWTINDEPTMRTLLGWGTDGIMTAEPTRLERVLCRAGTPRVERPRSFPGEHCSRRASIACDVRPTGFARRGKGASVMLRRGDDFDSRCAGQVRLKRVPGARGRFNFGWKPPAQGGPRSIRVPVRLAPRARRIVDRRQSVRVIARPYDAFPSSRRRAAG